MKLSVPLIIIGLFLLQGSQSHRVIGHFLTLHNVGDSHSDALIARNILLKKIEDSESDEDVFAFAEEVSWNYPFLFWMTCFSKSYATLMCLSGLIKRPPTTLAQN